jgi:hypothetical protein
MEEAENEEPQIEHGLNTDKELPNEAIHASEASEISNFKSQIKGELRNEATVQTGNEEPRKEKVSQ